MRLLRWRVVLRGNKSVLSGLFPGFLDGVGEDDGFDDARFRDGWGEVWKGLCGCRIGANRGDGVYEEGGTETMTRLL